MDYIAKRQGGKLLTRDEKRKLEIFIAAGKIEKLDKSKIPDLFHREGLIAHKVPVKGRHYDLLVVSNRDV